MGATVVKPKPSVFRNKLLGAGTWHFWREITYVCCSRLPTRARIKYWDKNSFHWSQY